MSPTKIDLYIRSLRLMYITSAPQNSFVCGFLGPNKTVDGLNPRRPPLAKAANVDSPNGEAPRDGRLRALKCAGGCLLPS